MKTKFRWWQLLLMVTGVALAVLVGLLVTAWLALRSPAVQQQVLTSLKEPLAKAGLSIDVKRLSVDVFAGLNLEQLQAKIDRPPLIQADVQLARVRLGYSFWGLLRKRLDISEVLIEGLRGDVRLVLDEKEKPEEPSSGLGPLIDLIRHPPVQLDGPSLIVRDNQLKLHLTQGTRQVEVSLNQADIDASIALKPGLLDLAADIEFDLAVKLDQAETLRVATHVTLEPEIVLAVRAPEKEFNWEFKLKGLELELGETQVHKTGLDLIVQSLELNTTLTAQRQGPVSDNPQVNEILWPLSSEGDLDLELAGIDLHQQKDGQSLDLNTTVRSENNWKIKALSANPGRDQNWDIDTLVQVLDLKAQQNQKNLASTKSIELSLKSQSEQGQGKAAVNLQVKPLSSEQLKAAVAYQQQLNLAFNLVDPEASLTAEGILNGHKILQMNGEGKDQNGILQAQLQMNLQPDPDLGKLHAGLQSLEQLGWPKIELQLSPHIQHPIPWSEVTKDTWHKLTITNSLLMNIAQQQPSPKNLARFKTVQIQSELNVPAREAGAAASAVDLNLKVTAERLQHKALKKSVDLVQDLHLQAQVGDRISGELKGKTRLDSYDLMNLELGWQDKPNELASQSLIRVNAEPALQKIVDAAKALDDFGGIKLQSEHKIKLVHGAARLQDIKRLDLNQIKADIQLTQIIEQTPIGQAQRTLHWQTPLRLDSRIQLAKGRADLLTRLVEPRITAQDQATVNNLQALIKASVTDLQKPDSGEVKLMVDADSIELLKEIPEQERIHKLLKRLKVIFHGTLENKDRINIKTAYFGLHDKLLQFKGQGAFRMNSQGHFDGQLESQIGNITDAPFTGTGSLLVPIKLVLFDKTRLSIDADPRFQNFSVQYGDALVKNLHGGIHMHEELSVDQGRIGFLYLDTQNPFARVDYDNLEPYVGDRPLLSMEQLRWKHILLGPLVANFEVRQNLILLNDLKMDLLQGSAMGRFYLDLQPERLQLGFLGRFSGLQLELVRESQRRLPTKEWAPLSGRMALNFDIRKRLATGRMDLTEVGKQQILSLLDVLDPEYKDDQMVMARRALILSYPQGVGIGMEQGLMDMNINLGGIIGKDIFIRSIPLTGLINAKAGESLQKVEKLLQSGGGS